MGICPKQVSLVVSYLQKLSGKSGWEVNGTWLFGLLQWKNVHIYKYFIIAKNVTFDYKITDGYTHIYITPLHMWVPCGWTKHDTAYITYDQLQT